MVTTSYPRFPGDSVGTFMEPIAKHVAARGHEVHIVAPWHPAHHARQGRGRRLLPFLQVRAGAGAERVRLRGGAARRRAAEGGGVDGGAARDGGRLVQGAARRAEEARHRHARPLGGAGRRHRRRGAARAAAGRQPARIGRLRRRAHGRRAARPRARVFDRAGFVTACSEDLARARGRARRRAPIGSRSCRTAWTSTRFKPAPERARRGPRPPGHAARARRCSSPPDAWCERRASST